MTILGKVLETDGDILDPSLYEGRITHNGGSVVNLHHTTWRIFYLLGIQLSQSNESKENDNRDDSNYNAAERKTPIVFGYCSRVGASLSWIRQYCIGSKISFTHLARRTGLVRWCSPKKVWMTRDQPGIVIPVCPIAHDAGDAPVDQSGCDTFAVSFWLRLPKHGSSVESNG